MCATEIKWFGLDLSLILDWFQSDPRRILMLLSIISYKINTESLNCFHLNVRVIDSKRNNVLTIPVLFTQVDNTSHCKSHEIVKRHAAFIENCFFAFRCIVHPGVFCNFFFRKETPSFETYKPTWFPRCSNAVYFEMRRRLEPSF